MSWKSAVNRALLATGYELRRVPRERPRNPRQPQPRVPQHLQSTSQPGTRQARMFFRDYPRFLSTSQTSPELGRLNLRYEAIFGENLDVFQDARVLDIASHDGRWSFAALKSGASHVVGIEGRADLVSHAEGNHDFYAVERDRFRFIAGDIFDALGRETPDVDVVLCLGFMYHTLRYNELLRRIRDMNPRCVIIDTAIARTGRRPFIKAQIEPVEREGNAITDAYSYNDRVLSGLPSIGALRRMLRAYGFTIDRLSDWGGLLRDNPGTADVDDYRSGDRITVRCRSLV